MFVVSGCDQRARPVLENIEAAYLRGLSENDGREEIGLRVIESSWICFRSTNGKDEWVSHPDDTSAVKVVKHDVDGELLWETDSYSSGRIISDLDSEYQEEIKLHCDYRLNQLEVTYLGIDEEIQAWVENSVGDDSKCITVIERVNKKWSSNSVPQF